MRDIEILLNLKTKTFLTIGSGQGEFFSSSDIIQIKRNFNGILKPCIPGSTFKGLLRSSAIEIAHFILGHENYCKTVDLKELYKDKQICEVCYLFGAGNNSSSKIICEDLFPITATDIISQYTHIRIDKKTGVIEKGALFTREQIIPGVEFQGKLYLHDLTIDKDNKLILLLFASLNNLNFRSFGNGNGLLDIKIKKIKNLQIEDEILKKIIEQMSYEK
ncbi:MAG: RAMP superfamily CRISPR-associated protein [Candidatus Helarchaeota archaeon]